MGFNITKPTPTNGNGIVTNENFTLLKQIIRDVTNGKEINEDVVKSFENIENFLNYFTSLKKLSELEKTTDGKGDYIGKLRRFKSGLEIYIEIPTINEHAFLDQHSLRVLGSYLNVNPNVNSELYDIILSWAKYRLISNDVKRELSKKVPDFYKHYKTPRDMDIFFFRWTLDNKVNMSRIIKEAEDKNLFLSEENGFHKLKETGVPINQNEYAYYVIYEILVNCLKLNPQEEIIKPVVANHKEVIQSPSKVDTLDEVFKEENIKESVIQAQEDTLDFLDDESEPETTKFDNTISIPLLDFSENDNDVLTSSMSRYQNLEPEEKGKFIYSLVKLFHNSGHFATYVKDENIKKKLLSVLEKMEDFD